MLQSSIDTTQLNPLQAIHNDVTKTLKYYHITPVLKSYHLPAIQSFHAALMEVCHRPPESHFTLEL